MNEIVEKKKTGRPSKYSKSIIKNILERLAKGESIRAVIKEENISWNTFRKWMNDDEQLRKDYETAKSDGIQFTIDDIEQLCKSTYSKALNKQVDLNAIKSLDILVRQNILWQVNLVHVRLVAINNRLLYRIIVERSFKLNGVSDGRYIEC